MPKREVWGYVKKERETYEALTIAKEKKKKRMKHMKVPRY
jgi:hypothetical protein